MSKVYAAAIFLPILCATGSAFADCDHFKWSVASERQWFDSGPSPIASGASISLENRAYRIDLRASGEVQFAQPPERPEKAGAFAGVVKIDGFDAGFYHVTISDDAWIDVVQDGVRLKSVGFSGEKDCPGVRKSVRFRLEKGSAAIQISNSRQDALMLAVTKAN